VWVVGGGAAELCFVVFVQEGCALSAARFLSLSLSLFSSSARAFSPPVVNENSLHSTGGLAGSGAEKKKNQ